MTMTSAGGLLEGSCTRNKRQASLTENMTNLDETKIFLVAAEVTMKLNDGHARNVGVHVE